MTGEMLFLLFAYPCADERKSRGLITDEQMKELEECIEKNKNPRRRLLKTCFSTAFTSQRDLAQKKGRSTWSLDNVKDYWYNNHRGFGDCSVKILCVSGIKDRIISASDECHEYQFVNIYNLSLKIKNHIMCHKGCVIKSI